MDEIGKDSNYDSKVQSLPSSNIQPRNRVDKIADIIVLVLAIVFGEFNILKCLILKIII